MRTEAGNVPGDLMVEYYPQRASEGGLLITEATAVSPLSLTFDHRVVTGGEAARFLAATIADLQMAQ